MAGCELLPESVTHLQTSLLFRSVVDTSSNDIPSRIYVRQETTESGTSSGQSELYVSLNSDSQ